jgi:sorbitol-specific phosphotransferase system component IIA
VVDPGALHLTIAAFFAPLENQAFISTVEISGNNQIVIGFSDRAPQDLGDKMAQELSEMPVTLILSGLTLDLSSLTSRAQIRAVGSQVEEILTATGSTTAGPAEPVSTGPAKLDQRDREFLDNVPPHHGV